MTSIPVPNKPSGARPPFDGGPTLTTFAPEPEENPDYLVARVDMHVEALERYSQQTDADPETVLELLNELHGWVEHLLDLERALSPTLLPPGSGALYSIEYLLEAESETITSYKRLLGRLDDARPTIERQVKLKKFLASGGETE